MKSLREIARASVGLSPVEKSKDVVEEWMHKSNQAYIYANSGSLPSGSSIDFYEDWSGSFHLSQLVPLQTDYHKPHWIISRCPWCNRRYTEKDCVCAGCGAPI